MPYEKSKLEALEPSKVEISRKAGGTGTGERDFGIAKIEIFKIGVLVQSMPIWVSKKS